MSEWFDGHPRTGKWSDKGSMLAPHEQMPMTSTSSGDSRHQTGKNWSGNWDAQFRSPTGMTRGGGTMLK